MSERTVPESLTYSGWKSKPVEGSPDTWGFPVLDPMLQGNGVTGSSSKLDTECRGGTPKGTLTSAD